MNSETELTIFISSRQNAEMERARRIAKETIDGIPFARAWLFEHTTASSENAPSAYRRHASEADMVVLLIGSDTSTAVIEESQSCMRANGRLLAFLLPTESRDQRTQDLVSRIGEYGKWCEVNRIEELADCIRSAVWDEVIRATRALTVPGRDPYLRRLLRESIASCEISWRSLGVGANVANELSLDDSVGFLVEPMIKETVFVVGKQGSGKSLAAARLFQRALRRASEDPMAPTPVYVKTRDLSAPLRTHITMELDDIAQLSSDPVLLIVDGVDEVSSRRSRELLADILTFVESHEVVSAVVTMRERPDTPGSDHIVEIPDLSQDDSLALMSRVSGRDLDRRDIWDWPASIKQATQVALFCIMIGSELAKGTDMRTSRPIELVHQIARRALEGANSSELELDGLLKKLAVAAVGCGASVAQSDFSENVIDQIRVDRSRLTTREGVMLDFALPIFRDWYAARAIRERGILVIEPRPFEETWVVPMAVAITSENDLRSRNLMGELARIDPGFAGRVMKATGQHWIGTGPSGVPPGTAIEIGELLRAAMHDWGEGLGELMLTLGPTTPDGRIMPIGVSLEFSMGSEMVTTAWYRGPTELEPVVELPRNINPLQPDPNWIFLGARSVEQTNLWPWNLAKDRLAKSLADLVDSRKLGACAAETREGGSPFPAR